MTNMYYPDDFPRDEFNQELEKILANKPLEIKEKELQDFIYDTLEKKGNCTIDNLVRIFTTWPKFIEETMNSKGYLKINDFNEGIYLLKNNINKS